MENKNMRWYPKQDMESLELSLKQGNAEKVMAIARELLERLKDRNMTLLKAKYLCFDVVNTIMKTLDEMNEGGQVEVTHYPDVLLLSAFNATEELEHIVLEVCESACENLALSDRSTEDSLLDKIRSYLLSHYNDDQFSVQQMADHFSLSSVYLGRYYKEHTGYTIAGYMNELRIEKAKQLLISSDIPMHELIREVGYGNVSSFIRRFKQSVKVTPGEYRKLHAKKPGEEDVRKSSGQQ